MLNEKRVVLELTASRLVLIAIVVALIATGLLIVHIDSTTMYVWIYPLNSARRIFVFYKSSVLADIRYVVEDYRTTSITTGILKEISLDSTGDYAIVAAYGYSSYVLATIVFSITGFILSYIVFRKIPLMSKWFSIIIALALLYLLPMMLLIIPPGYSFIDCGKNMGFSIHEAINFTKPIDEFKVDENTARELATILNLNYSYWYVIRDNNISTLTLVAFRVKPGDAEFPIVFFITNTSSGRSIEWTSGKSIYLSDGSVMIIVLSNTPLQNTTLSYYKAFFRENPSVSSLIIHLPLIILTIDYIFTGLMYLYLSRFYKRIERRQEK